MTPLSPITSPCSPQLLPSPSPIVCLSTPRSRTDCVLYVCTYVRMYACMYLPANLPSLLLLQSVSSLMASAWLSWAACSGACWALSRIYVHILLSPTQSHGTYPQHRNSLAALVAYTKASPSTRAAPLSNNTSSAAEKLSGLWSLFPAAAALAVPATPPDRRDLVFDPGRQSLLRDWASIFFSSSFSACARLLCLPILDVPSLSGQVAQAPKRRLFHQEHWESRGASDKRSGVLCTARYLSPVC